MKSLINILSIVFLLLFVAGCPSSSNKPEEKAKPKAERKPHKSRYPVDNLAPTSVVIRVNGHGITQADYRRCMRLRNKIFRITNRIPLDEKNEKAKSFAKESRMHVPFELVRRELMRQEAERLGVQVPEERIRKQEKRFMAVIRRPKEPFSNIDKLFGEDAVLVRDLVLSDARDAITIEKSATNSLTKVTEAELDAQIAYVKKWNETAERKNKEQRERALKAKADILNGAYFYDVTTNRADLAKEDGKAWQTVELGEFQADEPLARWLATAKQGDISDPIELDDGMAIVGLKLAYKTEAPPGGESNMQYDLVRCTFFSYDKLEEIEDRDELAKEMLAERRAQTFERLGGRLMDEAKIEAPFGENIFALQPKKQPAPKNNAKGGKKDKPAGVNKPADSGKSADVGKTGETK
jgi:hypothetical protein